MSRNLSVLILGLSSVSILAACDLLESAQSTIVTAGVIAASPEIQLDNYFDVKSQTLATEYLGQRASATSDEAPTPIGGADVTIQFAGNTVELKETSEKGVYETDSITNNKLIYAEGQTYAFVTDIPGNDAGPFGGAVKSPTRLSPASLTLTPTPMPVDMVPNVYSHPKMTDLQVSWTQMNGRFAWVTVFRATNLMDQPEQVFDSRPKNAQEMIKFILGTPPTSITIPASTFDRDGAYAVLVVAAEKGDLKTNTFLGSPILAGSGEKVLLAVGNFRP